MAALARGLPAGAALGRAPASAGRAGLFAGARLPPLRGHGAQEPARPPAGRCGALQEILLRAAPLAGRALDTRGARCAAHALCTRSEEHTSELQSQSNLVCRLLLEKKKKPETYFQLS